MTHPDDRDEKLAGLLAELTEQEQRGEAAQVERLAAEHPDLGIELRQLWAAAQLAQVFGRPRMAPRQELPATRAERTDPDHPLTPSSHTPTETLPRRFGDFDLLAVLGQGGMGIVYKAWDRKLKRIVALKMILRQELASESDLERFRTEAEAAAHLDHPAIVPVYGAGEIEGQPYFCMKYVEGKTLADLLHDGPLSPQEAARLLAPICRAVQHAHQQGLLHRDLKPSNILIDHDGQPHVADFGLAKRFEDANSLTGTGVIVGTPSYMAPEQATNSRGLVGPASDVYSLGAILYEMLTGRPPFQAPTKFDTLLLVLEQDPVPPRVLNPKVDPELAEICLQCLQKEPALRYANAARLADDLDRVLQGERPSARPSGVRYYLRHLLRETHHAPVLENWGLLWMWHSLKIFLLCVVTNWMYWIGVRHHGAYLALWTIGLLTWGVIFWQLRRRGGPVQFVERQIAHVWAAGIAGTISVFVLEVLLGMEALVLSPILAVLAGMVFVVKAGMLSGAFYLSAAALFLTAGFMALFPSVAQLLFGAVSAICFFVPGLKYHLRRLRTIRAAR
jgi:serine/threonine-protein kinase